MSISAKIFVLIVFFAAAFLPSFSKPASSSAQADSKQDPSSTARANSKQDSSTTVGAISKQSPAKRSKETKPSKAEKIDIKARSIANWKQQEQLEALIKKSKNDIKLDELVQKHLGTGFKRASVYDLYTLEPYGDEFMGMDEAKRKEFIDYYDYARKELVVVSQGPLLRSLSHDYDLDGSQDTALIVARRVEFDKKGLPRKSEYDNRIYLVVANSENVIYFQPLKADYLELINNGRYPTRLAMGKKLTNISAPAFRVLALDGESYVLYYDRSKTAWVKMYMNDGYDGG